MKKTDRGTNDKKADSFAVVGWGYSHNNCLLAYKMYYHNGEVASSLPPSHVPKSIEIPMDRPPPTIQPAVVAAMQQAAAMVAASAGVETPAALPKDDDVNAAELKAIVTQANKPNVDDRREVLREVREHLELLKEFEDVIPPEELQKRKRELFAALPTAPPPASRKARFTEDV